MRQRRTTGETMGRSNGNVYLKGLTARRHIGSVASVLHRIEENALRSAAVDSIDLASLADAGADAPAEADPRDDRPDDPRDSGAA